MEQTAVVVAGEAPASSTGCDWTKLPAYLLVRIFGSLQIRDLFSSGGVCSSWRRSHPEARRLRLLCSPHHSPCLVCSAADRDDGTATLHHLCTGKLYHFTIPGPAFRSRYVMGSSHGWLITADDRSRLILVNPITGAQVAMPPPETMHNVELRYGEEGRRLDGYDLIYADTVPHPKIEPYRLSPEQGRFCFYMVVAMSCDPSSENCVVVRVHMPKSLLSYARVGDTKWTWVDTHEECKSYVDVCYDSGDGLFYALRGCGDVHTIDLRGPSALVNIVYKHKSSPITPPPPGPHVRPPNISLSPPSPIPSLPSTRRRRRPISGEIPSPAGSHGLHLQRRRDRPLLRLPRRRRRPRLLLHGRGVRDGQERGGGGVDGGDAAGAGDEVHRARRHGRGARDLRPHHRRHHLHRDQPQGQALLPLRRLRAPLLRPRLRPRRARRRHGHRHRRRRRRQGQCTAAQAVRRHDPHPHLCRSPGPVRPHRRHHPLLACRPIPRRLETKRLRARSIRSIIVFCLKGFISS